MKKRYKVMFNLEGAIEVIASCDECGFSVSLYEMDEGV